MAFPKITFEAFFKRVDRVDENLAKLINRKHACPKLHSPIKPMFAYVGVQNFGEWEKSFSEIWSSFSLSPVRGKITKILAV
jgi:hypothetical protein